MEIFINIIRKLCWPFKLYYDVDQCLEKKCWDRAFSGLPESDDWAEKIAWGIIWETWIIIQSVIFAIPLLFCLLIPDFAIRWGLIIGGGLASFLIVHVVGWFRATTMY